MLVALLALPLVGLPSLGEDELRATLHDARASIDAGRPESARRAILTAVEHQADEPRAVARHWAEVEELLSLATFWQGYELPEPEDVVSGDLLSYDARSGSIKLRYRGDSGDERWKRDFAASEGIFTHPLKFTGTYHVELSGAKLPDVRNRPTVVVGYDWNTAYAVTFGDYARILRLEGGQPEVLDDRTLMLVRDEPYSFKVSLGATTVTAFYNRKRIFRVKRPKGEYGQFGFLNMQALQEVTITGEVEPSWIAGLIDEHKNTAWAAFLERYDARDDLPPWVSEAVSGEAEDAASYDDARPPSATDADRALIERVLGELRAGRSAGARAIVRNEANVSVPALNWCAALLGVYTGDLEVALQACDETIAIDDGFLEARLMRAELLQVLRSSDEAETELREAARDFPRNAAPRRALAEHYLHRERYADAHRAIVEGIDAGIPARALAAADRNRLRALYGPRFAEPYEYVSKHYVIVSDMGRSACFEVAEELEKFFLKYNRNVRRLPSDDGDRRFRVYLFSGLSGYETYCKDLFGDEPESELGRYSLTLKQLLIWNSPDRRWMMRTVRHEGFHQYLDRLSGEAPVWLHEGMAEYFEQSKIVRGRWQDDQVVEQHLAVLERSAWTPLEKFVQLESRGFRANTALHYAQGWAFVHFLTNSSRREDRARLDELLDALAEGAPRSAALERSFADTDWPDLESRFRAHVAALR